MVDFIGENADGGVEQSRWKRMMRQTKDKFKEIWGGSDRLPNRKE